VIGDIEDDDRGAFIECIESVLSCPLKSAWSEHCFSLVDGLGAYRVVNSMGLKIEY